MDALILSCGTGGGHNSVCEAIEQALSATIAHASERDDELRRLRARKNKLAALCPEIGALYDKK